MILQLISDYSSVQSTFLVCLTVAYVVTYVVKRGLKVSK